MGIRESVFDCVGELGVTDTVHCVDGITAPMTMVLELIEKEPSTFPIVLVLDAIEVTQGDVPC